MNISTLQENLKNALYAVSHVAGKNVNLPILNNVLIEAKDGHIRLVATDLEIGITTSVRGKVESAGAITIEAKIISDYVALLPNQKVALRLKDRELTVECDNYHTKIKGQAADEYPLIPSVEKKKSFSLEAAELRRALSQVLFATATSDTRLELTGVLFVFAGDRLTLAATDSYRLAEKTVSLSEAGGGEESVVIPAKTLLELARLLSAAKEGEDGADGKVKCYLSDNQALFSLGKTELVSRLIEGQYPDYRQIIPTTSKTTAVIAKNELTRAVKAAALFSKAGINDVNLDFPEGKNKLIITSASGQTGENTTELPATVQGKDNGVVINYRYLLDGLNNIDAETVKIEIIDSNTPCLLRPAEEKDYIYIIMPIKQ